MELSLGRAENMPMVALVLVGIFESRSVQHHGQPVESDVDLLFVSRRIGSSRRRQLAA